MSALLLLHIFIQAKFVSLLAAQVEDLNKMFFRAFNAWPLIVACLLLCLEQTEYGCSGDALNV